MVNQVDRNDALGPDGLIASIGQVAQEKAIGTAVIGLIVMGFASLPSKAAAWYAGGVVASAIVYFICSLTVGRVGKSRVAALLGGRSWNDRTVLIQFVVTPLATGAAMMLAIWTFCRALQGQMPGDVGSVLVLVLTGSMAAKLAAETYLFSWIGTSPTDANGEAHLRSAQLLAGEFSRLTTIRFTLGILGGIIMPLGAQILASGAKNIPASAITAPSVILSVAALVCLIPGEMLGRSLYYRVTR